jgi:competence protein ComEC
VLCAYRLGRLSSAGGAVLFAACVMALINPLIVRDDVGFQLSFLAVIGIMYAHEPVAKIFSWLPNPLGIREGFTMTLAAQLTTMPLLVYQFGRVSIIAPLANIVLVPIIAPLTIMGSGIIIGSSFFPEVHWWWLLPQIVLQFLLTSVYFFSQMPYASVTL